LLAACGAAQLPPPTETAPLPSLATLTEPPAPTLTEAPSPTPTSTIELPSIVWPTYTQPTLAPFPLTEVQLASTPEPQTGFPAIQAPLALSVHDHFYFTFPVANVHLGLYSPSQRYGVRQEPSLAASREPH